jgi:hypothetical protein
MLMMLTPSRPSRANTMTTTPRMLTLIATQRPALSGWFSGRLKDTELG